MTSTTRRLTLGATVALGIILAFAPASADTSLGARAGVYTEDGDGFVGAEALASMSRSWYFNPNLEYAFADNDYLTVSGDFHYDLVHRQPYYVWLGGGPTVILRDDDPVRDDTDLGVNLLAGIGWKNTSFTPYVQSKVTLADDDQFGLAFGMRF
jgi:hypothetical protein